MEFTKKELNNWPVPDDLEKMILEEPFKHCRYMFYKRGKGFWDPMDYMTGIRSNVYFGYCSYCQKEYVLQEQPEHGTEYICPGCGSSTKAHAAGRGRGKLQDHAYIMSMAARDGALYAASFHVCIDFRDDYLKARITFKDRQRWYFGPEGMTRYRWQIFNGSTGWGYDWQKYKTIADDYEARMKIKSWIYPLDNVDLESTVVRHAHLKEYMKLDEENGGIPEPIRYLATYMKWPSIEHLIRPGLIRLANEKINGSKRDVNKIINWKKTRPRDMFGIPHKDINRLAELLSARYSPDYNPEQKRYLVATLGFTVVWILCKKHNIELTPHQEKMIMDLENKKQFVSFMMGDHFLRKLNYINKQTSGIQNTNYVVFSDWMDYLEECRELGYDITDDVILYPRSLKAAHDRVISIRKYTEDEALRSLFGKRYKKLNRYSFEADGLFIRPCRDESELIREGKVQRHCVGGYASQHAKGYSAIFFIRRSEAPDQSYYTLEFDEKNKRILQNRGFKNSNETPEVITFRDQWLVWVKAGCKKARKIKVA